MHIFPAFLACAISSPAISKPTPALPPISLDLSKVTLSIGAGGKSAAVAPSATSPKVEQFLVLPMWFTGTDTTFSVDSMAATLRGANGMVSINDYLLQQSGGRIGATLRFRPWRKSSHNRDSCGTGSPTSTDCIQALMAEAAGIAQAEGVDLSPYDNDGDGIVDGLVLIYSGNSSQGTRNPKDPVTEFVVSPTPVASGNVHLKDVVFMSEFYGAFPSAVGHLAHELIHQKGAADLYDGNYALQGLDGGIGPWDIMCTGSEGLGYDANLRSGPWKPTGLSAFTRISIGWATPLEVDSTREVRLAPGQIARLWTDPYRTRQYLLLENRDRSGVDSILPGPGLLVNRVRPLRQVVFGQNFMTSPNIDSSDMGVTLMEASGQQRFARNTSKSASSIDLFGIASDTLTDNGPVPLRLPDGTASGAWIRDVRIEGNDVVFRAQPSPKRGYGLGKWDNYLNSVTITGSAAALLDSIRIPESGRIVALQTSFLEGNSSTCTQLWTSLENVQAGSPLASVCDTAKTTDGTAHTAYHILQTPLPVSAGQLLYLGQTASSSTNTLDLPVIWYRSAQDSIWLFVTGYQPGRYNLSVAARAILEVGSASSIHSQMAQHQVFMARQVGNTLELRGLAPMETFALSLRGIDGRRIWSGTATADESGKARISRPKAESGVFVLEAKGATSSDRTMYSPL